MFKYKLILFLAIITMFSCDKKKARLDDYFTDLPCENVVGVKVHDFDSMGGLLFRLYSDNRYTIVRSGFTDYAYELMDNNISDKFTPFVKIGRGPQEVIGGGTGCFFNDTTFCSMSINGDQKLAFYNLNDVVKDSLTKPYNEIDVKANGAIRVGDFFITNDSVIVGRNDYNDSLRFIATFDLKTNKIGDYVECSFMDDDVFLPGKNALYCGDLKCNMTRDKFVFNSFNGDIIYFCKVNSSGEVEILKDYALTAPEYDIKDGYGVWPNRENFNGTQFIVHKGNKFYVQNIGKPYKQLIKEQNTDRVITYTNIILVFDENGNPICKYILDKEAINIFQYKESIIVKVNENGEEVFYQYDI